MTILDNLFSKFREAYAADQVSDDKLANIMQRAREHTADNYARWIGPRDELSDAARTFMGFSDPGMPCCGAGRYQFHSVNHCTYCVARFLPATEHHQALTECLMCGATYSAVYDEVHVGLT